MTLSGYPTQDDGLLTYEEMKEAKLGHSAFIPPSVFECDWVIAQAQLAKALKGKEVEIEQAIDTAIIAYESTCETLILEARREEREKQISHLKAEIENMENPFISKEQLLKLLE